jgi:hypothetical protein
MKHQARYLPVHLGILLAASLFLVWLTNQLVLTAAFYQASDALGLPGEGDRVYAELQQWIYLSAAAYLLVKVSLTALVLYTALYLAEQPVQFTEIFRVVVLAEFVFVAAAAIKLAWFHFYYPAGTLPDWHRVYMLSALSLTGPVPADWSYALQTLNLFEIGYWFLLAYGIFKLTALSFDRSLRLVLTAYLPALLIWVVLVTFCTLLLFPSNA